MEKVNNGSLRNLKNAKSIFISWSGNNSKEFAKELKTVLEDIVFEGTGLTCFVSDLDIHTGDDWWKAIRDKLSNSKLGIICITRENVRSPWIHFEAGAMIARGLKVVPLLLQNDIDGLSGTPLATRQAVDFSDVNKFYQMIRTINNDLNLLQVADSILETIAKDGHSILLAKTSPIIYKLKKRIGFSARYVYPSNITYINQNSIYISASMSSISREEYDILRRFVLELMPVLKTIGFDEVICPLFDNPDYNNFDGSTKAIMDNFKKLKRSEAVLVIYPKSTQSSVLPEIGYALALSKKTAIFFKESLPYILKDAGLAIPHIHYSACFSRYEEITHTILSNGKQLFGYEEELEK